MRCARQPHLQLIALLSLLISSELWSAPPQEPVKGASLVERLRVGVAPKDQPRERDPLLYARVLQRQGDHKAALEGPLREPPAALKVGDELMGQALTAQEWRAWGAKGRRALHRAHQLSWRLLSWESLKRVGASDELSASALELLELSQHPRELRERLELSAARAQLNAWTSSRQESPHKALDQGDLKSLKQRLTRLVEESQRARDRAEALGLLSSLSRLSQRPQEASRYERELWLSYGHTPTAKALSTPGELSAQHWLQRAEALFKARAYTPALEALKRLKTPPLPHSLSSQELAQSALIEAIIHMRLYQNDPLVERLLHEAQSLSARASQGAEPRARRDAELLEANVARYQAIHASRLAQWDEAIEATKRQLRAARGARRDEALYQLGRLAHQAGRYQEAISSHKALLASKRGDPERVRWFLGWSHYRAGDCRSARAVWRPLLSEPNLLEGPQASYWSARCYEREGSKKQALKQLKQLLQEAPLSYYGLLAAQRLSRLKGEPFTWEHPLKGRMSARQQHLKLARPPSLKALTQSKQSARGWRKRASAPLWEALALKRVGLDEHARERWVESCEGAGWATLRRGLGREARAMCEQSGLWVGAYGALWRRGTKQRAGWRIAGHKGLLKRAPELRVKAYPLAYEGLVRASAALEGLSPWWLLGHMFQESRYRPNVVSHAQAIGLMQLLERTGRRLSERLGWPAAPFSGEQLFQPGVAIRLASTYLKLLWLELGHPILAMGAYNGGPMRFRAHLKAHPALSFEELIEELGAHESRNYMRKITDHTLRYLALYGSEEAWALWVSRLALPERPPQPKGDVDF